MNNEQYFFCYNKRVSDYLIENGLNYITVAIDPRTKKMYSLYRQTDELKKLLTEYKLNIN
jgi:hypothetical protein